MHHLAALAAAAPLTEHLPVAELPVKDTLAEQERLALQTLLLVEVEVEPERLAELEAMTLRLEMEELVYQVLLQVRQSLGPVAEAAALGIMQSVQAEPGAVEPEAGAILEHLMEPLILEVAAVERVLAEAEPEEQEL
tara:strand:+ start:7479 stop:7889 length:411 start_codon:yes stop_codon:yes gene_type:complete